MLVSFTIDDFQDLLRLLEQRPEWRAELRRHVLTDELLTLPALTRQLAERVDRLAETQERIAEQLSGLTLRVDALTARVEALADAQARTEARLEVLAEAQTRTEVHLGTLAAAQAQLTSQLTTMNDRVGDLTGTVLEFRYRERAGAYFSPLARRLHVVDFGRLADRLDDAVEAGQLTAAERTEVLQSDLVLSGVRRADGAQLYLVVEVSKGVGRHDVARAEQRARLLTRLGQPAVPVVAGEWIATEAQTYARTVGVWQVLDGHAVPPDGPSSG